MEKLDASFYLGNDVVEIAKALVGKVLVTTFEDVLTSGRIVETEAYNGVVDKASHAFGGRNTERTKVMYMMGGHAYVYLCYGIHHLFNVVTNVAGVPQAVLIRSVEALEGVDKMLERTAKKSFKNNLLKGPGVVSKGLGICKHHTATSLLSGDIFIGNDGFTVNNKSIKATPRIGVGYAGDDALLPYRFIDSRFKELG
jgi:DNA-3-methyladenine glycosylase